MASLYLLVDGLCDVDFDEGRFVVLGVRGRDHCSELIFDSVEFVVNFHQFNLFVFLLTHSDYITFVSRLLAIISHQLQREE